MSEIQRKFTILHTLIREYVNTAEPVGSEVLRKRWRLEWSPATIRNDFMELEAEGYLAKPHISGGRIPTDKAYRHYVNQLLEERKGMEQKATGKLKTQSQELEEMTSPDEMVHAAAKLMARLTKHLVLGGILERKAVFDSGLAQLVEEPEFIEQERIADVARFMEDFTDNVLGLTKRLLREDMELYIGGENPISDMRSCTMLISDFDLPSGEQGFIAMIGPTRMRYERNIGLLEGITDVFNSRES